MNKQYQVIKGAIEADTNKFILPQFGLKGIHYKCFDKTCKMPVIKVASYVRQDGTKIYDYFRHIRLTDEECECKRYSRNTRLTDFEIHKEGVMNLNYLLENNQIDKRLVRYCPCCLSDKLINKEVEILQDNERLETEYSFKHNGRNLRADIARLRDGKIFQIYEIKYSHATREEDRPNDIEWYEIDAQDINKQLEQMQNFDDREIILSCLRENLICPSCNIIKEKIDLEMKEALEEQIRCNAEREKQRLIKMKEDEEREEEHQQELQRNKQRREEQEIKNKQQREEQEIKNKQLREEQEIIDKQSTEKRMLKQKQDEERRREYYKAKTEEQSFINKQIRKEQEIQKEELYKQHREEQEIKHKLWKEEQEIKNKLYLEEEKQRNIKIYTPEQLAKIKEYDELQAKIEANFARIGTPITEEQRLRARKRVRNICMGLSN
jgi:hypothetical protein